MHRLPENGIVIGPYGSIGYYERNTASESEDLFTALRSLMRRLLALIY